MLNFDHEGYVVYRENRPRGTKGNKTGKCLLECISKNERGRRVTGDQVEVARAQKTAFCAARRSSRSRQGQRNENRYGWDINLQNQPANPPDFNVLILGVFHAIQSLTWDRDMQTIRKIVKSSKDAFLRLKPSSINDVFFSLQKYMECSMKVGGGNNFKEPHMYEVRRRTSGEVIARIHVVRKRIAIAKSEQVE